MIKGIKYALNSSIGTKFFKPLDKMIDKAITLVPSEENTLISWDEFAIRKGEEKKFILNAVSDGGCYLKISTQKETINWIYINLYVNNNLVGYHRIYEPTSFPFYFKKGDVVEIVITAESLASETIYQVAVKGKFAKRNCLVEVRQ